MFDYEEHKNRLYQACQEDVRVANADDRCYGVDDIIARVFYIVWDDMVSRIMELENGMAEC